MNNFMDSVIEDEEGMNVGNIEIDSFGAADSYSQGEAVWIEGSECLWVPATVIRQENFKIIVLDSSTGLEKEIDMEFSDVHKQSEKIVPDLALLSHINEPSILNNLRIRSLPPIHSPYTWAGNVLICLNPLNSTEKKHVKEFENQPFDQGNPHPYTMAEFAFQRMRQENQSIILAGESGSGKTEVSSKIVRFLTSRGRKEGYNNEIKVMASLQILEAFGNAKTIYNPNSTRFGQYQQLQFSEENGLFAGAYIHPYLLEKSRVVSRQEGERSFHIFYYLIAGLDDDSKNQIGLSSNVDDYPDLYQDIYYNSDDAMRDIEVFNEVVYALNSIGISQDIQTQIWSMIAAVLTLLCMEFEVIESETEGSIPLIPEDIQKLLAHQLGISPEMVDSFLIHNTFTSPTETSHSKRLNLEAAYYHKNSCACTLYNLVFSYVVEVLNQVSLPPQLSQENMRETDEDSQLPFIGILDTFGFCNTDKNGLETLLINYFNETLQNMFNRDIFIDLINLYETEGIKVNVSSCHDNSDCIRMIGSKSSGILNLLDAACRENEPNESMYCAAVHSKYSRDKNFPMVHKRETREAFAVKHYAGDVKYSVEGWVSMNIDRVPESFQEALSNSALEAVHDASSLMTLLTKDVGTKSNGLKMGKQKPTMVKKFADDLEELVRVMENTQCNYIRCLKPNDNLEYGIFDDKFVAKQLQSMGILQTCELLRVCYPVRISSTEVKEILMENVSYVESLFLAEPENVLTAAILWALDVPSYSFKMGSSCVFFSADQISKLDNILKVFSDEEMKGTVRKIQEAFENRQAAKVLAGEAEEILMEANMTFQEVNEALNAESNLLKERPPSNRHLMNHNYPSIVKKTRKAANSSQILALMREFKDGGLDINAQNEFILLSDAAEGALDKIELAREAADALEQAISSASESNSQQLFEARQEAIISTFNYRYELEQRVLAVVEASKKCLLVEAQNDIVKVRELSQMLTESAAASLASFTASSKGIEMNRRATSSAVSYANMCEQRARDAEMATSDFFEVVKRIRIGENLYQQEEVWERNGMAHIEDERLNPIEENNVSRGVRPSLLMALEEAERLSDDEIEQRPSHMPQDSNKMHKNQIPNNFGHKPFLPVQNAYPGPDEPHANVPVQAPMQPPAPQPPKPDFPPGIIDMNHIRRSSQISASRRTPIRQRFDEVANMPRVEGYLKKRSKILDRWKSRYFILESNHLEYYDKKSNIGTEKKKSIEITKETLTSMTNTKNCFCVKSEEEVWLMLAKDNASVIQWMTAINSKIYNMYMEKFTVPEDNFWNAKGACPLFGFYRASHIMGPQWIRLFPELDSPRTGNAVQPGENVEVIQAIQNEENAVFLRLADERGWVILKNPKRNNPLFENVRGEFAIDTKMYGYLDPNMAAVPIFRGPSQISMRTGDAIKPGNKVQACLHFVPYDSSGVMFVKLADGRGWIPVKKNAKNL